MVTSFNQKLRTAQYLAANAGPLWIKRFLRNLSPETTLALVNELERTGMPTALNLEIPSWRVEQVVARTVTLESASTISIPSNGPLPEESHGWLPYRARELQGVTLDVDSGLAFVNDLVIAQSGSGTRASRDAAFVSGATARIKSRQPKALNGAIAPLGDVHHHYHVMLETLPRMLHAQLTNPEVKFLTSARIPDRYMNLFYDLDLTIEQRNTGDVVVGNPLVLVDQPDLFWPRRADIEALNKAFQEGRASQSRRFFIRRSSDFRAPLGEQQLEDALLQEGFESITMADLSIREQWELGRQAETVLGSHGAALWIAAAMPAGSLLTEFSSGEMFEFCYRRLAAVRNINYKFLNLGGSPSQPFGNFVSPGNNVAPIMTEIQGRMG